MAALAAFRGVAPDLTENQNKLVYLFIYLFVSLLVCIVLELRLNSNFNRRIAPESKKIMSAKLFNNCVKELKEVGYYHVSIEKDTGRLVAAYTPPDEVLELMQKKDAEYMSAQSYTAGRFREFDLVIDGWELDSCRPWVVIQPDGRRSPGHIYSDGSKVSYAPGKRSAAIKKIGEMALTHDIA